MAVHFLVLLCVVATVFTLCFYLRDGSPGLPQVVLIAIGSLIFIYGFVQATKWSRPLVVLYLLASTIWWIFRNHATYSFRDLLGTLLTVGFIIWILYVKRDVRDYYAKAGKTVC